MKFGLDPELNHDKKYIKSSSQHQLKVYAESHHFIASISTIQGSILALIFH